MQWLHDALTREDDPVGRFLLRLITANALVWLTVHGTKAWRGR